MRINRKVVLSMILIASTGMANADNDPLEGLNRSVYSFNSTVDKYALKPIAKGYKAVTPDLVEAGVSNFFANLGDVSNLVNDVLQLKLKDAVVDLGRLSFNSTFGLAGLIDVATPMGLQRNNEDFGQTLGAWGVPSGPYVVMPFFGPSTLRDAPASFVPLDPVFYVDDNKTRNALYAGQMINARAGLLKYEALITGDQYIFVRDAYLGRREQLVNDGVAEEIFDSSDF